MESFAATRSGPEAHVRFYRRVMEVLARHHVPFLVGGAYALAHYSEVGRTTKDLDLFIRRDDWARLASVLADYSIATSVPFPHWLGKAQEGDSLVDMVFTSGNGLCPVDDSWFERAAAGEVLGVEVKICAPEELIWSKAFIMERERYDGADVMHLIRATYHTLDWNHLIARFGEHWEVLLSISYCSGTSIPDRNIWCHVVSSRGSSTGSASVRSARALKLSVAARCYHVRSTSSTSKTGDTKIHACRLMAT